jgi:hypothetical protein
MAIDIFRQEMIKMKIDNSWIDIIDDYQPYLDKKFAMV